MVSLMARTLPSWRRLWKTASVLPARFDDVSLPGLPPTVGYLDISNRKPEEVADLVLTKLNRVDA